MAKKKETKKVDVTTSVDTQVLKLAGEIKAQAMDICNLSNRIDRIVTALGKSKSVRGM